MNGTVLCRADEIGPGEAKGFVLGSGTARRELMVVRGRSGLHAYENCCPHQGTPLNILEDDFFAEDGLHLVCRTHGALFLPHDGTCVAGPCQGKSLRRLAIDIVDGMIVLAA